MNSISPLDAVIHKASNVDLRDVWEDSPPPPIPALESFEKNLTYGRAQGNTWGYQSKDDTWDYPSNAKTPKRLDKLLYTGSVDTVPLTKI